MSCSYLTDLFGETPEERKPQAEIANLDFEGHGVRVIKIKGDPWFVASDVCRVLEFGNISQTLSRLDDDEKDNVITNDVVGRSRELAIVSEAGLYNLIFTSRKAEAKRFKRWVVHEVLPAIRKTGTYSIQAQDAITREAKRLKCDPHTAANRLRVKAANKRLNSIKAANGAKPIDFAAMHNAAWKGQFGLKYRDVHKRLGLKKSQRVLDYLGMVILSQREHGISLVCKIEKHRGLTPEQKLEAIEHTCRKLAQNDLQLCGPGSQYGIVDDGRRGRIIDLIIPQLATA